MRIVSRVHVTLCIGLLFCGVMLAYGQASPLTVSGQVTGADGLPKRFARVQLEGPASYMAITNTRGEFSIANVQPGRYVATVTQGDNVQKVTVNIAKAPTPVNITVKW